MRIGILACLIALACCGAADPPTPATQPVKRSTTVEGLTLTLWVPPEIDWDTPLKAQLRNDSDQPVVLLRMRAAPEGAPEWFKRFGVELRDATGKQVLPTYRQPVPKTRLRLVLGPGEQIPQPIRLDLLCKAPPPGAYTMTVDTVVAKGDGGEVSLQLKDVLLEIVRK